MTSDIYGTVTAIQGNPVVEETLGAAEDGYVLTWDNADGYLVARSPSNLQSVYFTSDGYWTCPESVTSIILIGAGGGGGGGDAYSASGGGGGGSIQTTCYVPVTPNTTYSITIGAGGPSSTDGSTTSFSTLAYFNGASGGLGYSDGSLAGPNIAGLTGSGILGAASGGNGSQAFNNVDGINGYSNWSGNGNYVGGIGGTSSSLTGCGGGGGGAGPQGNGANGGNGTTGFTGSTGGSAAPNSGAGGGGAGGSILGGGPPGGGNGGSGYLYIIY